MQRGRRLRNKLASQSTKFTSKPGSDPGFVLLVAPSGSYRISAYSKAADALGMPVLVASNSEHSLVPEVASGITVDFSDPESAFNQIITAISDLIIDCIIATDDSCVGLCSDLGQHLGLPQNSQIAAELTQRKDLGREALKVSDCNVPDFQVIKSNAPDPDMLRVAFPLVIKPLGLSASRGVIRANNRQEFVDACRRVDSILQNSHLKGYSREHLLIESYIEGDEYAVEGFITDGEFQLLTVFDKPEPLEGPYFEETYYITPSRLTAHQQELLRTEVAKCCAAYGLSQGPIHAELRMSPAGPTLLELAARTIGGQCGQLIEFSLQQKLEELVIKGMCGLPLSLGNERDSAGVLMIPIRQSGILKRVEGLTEAMQVKHVRDVEIHISPGYEMIPLPEGASYLGFIFAQAPDFNQTYQALKTAFESLRFVTQPKWDLQQMAKGT
ncbi:MAG: ATP-grasp domain-containing protein [Pseudomonadota bacterium]